jgi:hypothetical protein
MKFTNFSKMIQVAAFGAAVTFGVSGTAALADNIQVSFGAATVQTPDSTVTTHYETFDNGFTGKTNFGGSGINGTYAGYTLDGFNEYGGAGGTGSFLTTSSTYTLSLDSNVNYFGFWLSALDSGNQVQLFSGNTAVAAAFIPTDLIAALGSCPANTTNNYCGNPNTGTPGSTAADIASRENAGQLYAYVQFYDTDGTFDKVVYTESPNVGGYESDNHSVAVLTSAPGGTVVTSPVPEPSSLVLLGTGVLGVAGSLRRKLLAR